MLNLPLKLQLKVEALMKKRPISTPLTAQERDWLNEVFDLYYDELLRYGCRMAARHLWRIPNRLSFVEDCLQDTFVKLGRALGEKPELRLRSGEEIRRWLYMCFQNTASIPTAYRRQKNLHGGNGAREQKRLAHETPILTEGELEMGYKGVTEDFAYETPPEAQPATEMEDLQADLHQAVVAELEKLPEWKRYLFYERIKKTEYALLSQRLKRSENTLSKTYNRMVNQIWKKASRSVEELSKSASF